MIGKWSNVEGGVNAYLSLFLETDYFLTSLSWMRHLESLPQKMWKRNHAHEEHWTV